MLFGIELLEQLHHLNRRFAVQCTRRFIGKDELRLRNQGPCDGHTLPLSARHFIGIVSSPRQKSHLLKIFHGQLPTLSPPHPLIEQRQFNIFHSRFKSDKVETLKDKTNHFIAIMRSFCFRKIAYERATEHILSTIIVIKDT